MVQPTRTKVTTADYFKLEDYAQHDLIQLIDGEVVLGHAKTPSHQRLVREIIFLFMSVARQIGADACLAPIEVVLDEENVFEPDVLYLAPNSQCTICEKRLTGAPELVVEVLSPSTAKYDRQQKYTAYEQHGVAEYWIVDPVHKTIEVWTLDTNKQFQRQGAYAEGDTFQSKTLNHPIDVKPIFKV